MIKKFSGLNISSKNPKRLVLFYKETLSIPVLEDDSNYDGVSFGFLKDAPVFWIWDENRWGKSSDGKVNLVFECDSLDKTYEELKEAIDGLKPPKTAIWGGKEMHINDPDGNIILLLE
ncbi:hypothetical protein CI105_08485 [Candidatus Izimaplasma bacterium ZiA1]|uniref:VOC family protein n=1 Tax=Candidatus Izimoplasma sp. ZiA1 TaxID=2024899 RepID=UPI000BAA7428|nr:hypothetical protein CI105_08485 [Candidatus Izimaplasma bacterium ZiA1]